MLNRDDVIRMAQEAGFHEFGNTILACGEKLERFAAASYAAGKAAERERILSICNEVSAEWFNCSGGAVECIRRIEEMK